MEINILSQQSFLLIRNLLEGRIRGGEELALELADALHNLPTDEDPDKIEITRERLVLLIKTHPQIGHLKNYL